MATISLWEILLLIRGDLELANTATSPCYHHTDTNYDFSIYYQLFNTVYPCPSQQATACSNISAKVYKLHSPVGIIYHSPLDGHRYKGF